MEHLQLKIGAKLDEIGNVTAESTLDIINKLNREEVVRQIPLITFLLLIVLTGIPGNGLVCFIYRSKYFMSSSRWFIFFLAAVDLLMCMLMLPGEIATTFFQYKFTNAAFCKISTFLNLWSLLTLGLTLLAVSVDRYRKVCKPLGWQINFNKARILSFACVLLALFIALPVLWVYNIYDIRFEEFQITVYECSFRSDGMNLTFLYVLFGMTLFVTALTSICILYCFIGREIKRHIDKERVKRHISMTASMAFNTNLIRPITQEIKVNSMKKSVGFYTPPTTSLKPKKSVNFGGVVDVKQANGRRTNGNVNVLSGNIIKTGVRRIQNCGTEPLEISEKVRTESNNLRMSSDNDCKSCDMVCNSEYRPFKKFKEIEAMKCTDDDADLDTAHLDGSCPMSFPCEKQQHELGQTSSDLAVNTERSETLNCSSIQTMENNALGDRGCLESTHAEREGLESHETANYTNETLIQESSESMMSPDVTSVGQENVSTEREESSSNANYADEESMDNLDLPPKRTLTLKERKKSKRTRRARAKKATLSMIMISMAFVLSYLPFLCLLLLKTLRPELEKWMADSERVAFKFFLRSYFFNCAINPFIYGISDSKFRQSCKEVIQKVFGRMNFRRVLNFNG